jgi:hypothetical protein
MIFEEVSGGLHHPSEGWGRPAKLLSGWPEGLEGVEVEIFDESTRPGLSLLEEGQWLELLEEFGFSAGEASELRDLLLDWMDEDDDERFQGRENSDLGRSRDPWVPNRPPRSWSEVWSIPEWREAAFDERGQILPWAGQLSSFFSLEHDAPANINAVDSSAVEWLNDAGLIPYPGWLDERDGRDNEPGSADDRILTELPGGGDEGMGQLFSADSQVLRIRASLRVGERFVWKEAWITRIEEEEEEREPPGNGPRIRVESGDEAGVGESTLGEWRVFDVREGLSLVLEEEDRVE